MRSFTEFLVEKKDHIIKKMPLLSKDEKEHLIKIFGQKPHLENQINWNKWKTLTYADFAEIILSTSKREKKKVVKSKGIKGLKENVDYIELNLKDKTFEAYIPLTWEASKMIASKYIGNCEGAWCTAYQKDRRYWKSYVEEDGIVLVYLIHPENAEKYAFAIYPDNTTYEIFDHDDNAIEDIPGFNEGVIFTSANKKIFDQVRSNILMSSSFLKDAKYSPDSKFRVIGANNVHWYSGTWIDGDWKGGVWEDGTFLKGNFEKGNWMNGTFKGNIFTGTWNNGIWEGSEFGNKNTVWVNGVFKEGNFHGGRWINGVWEGGVWVSGSWNIGRDKNGNEYKMPPTLWSERTKVDRYLELFELHNDLDTLFTKFEDTLDDLVIKIESGIVKPVKYRKKVNIVFDRPTQIRIHECIINTDKIFTIEDMSVVFEDCEIENFKYDSTSSQQNAIMFQNCSIKGGNYVLQDGLPFLMTDIRGGTFFLDKLKQLYRSAWENQGVVIMGGNFVSKDGAKKGHTFTDYDLMKMKKARNATFIGLMILSMERMSNCVFHNCYLTAPDTRYDECNILNCQFDKDMDLGELDNNNTIKEITI